MSKKKWILIILVAVFIGYLVISKVVPAVGTAVDNALGPVVSGFFAGIYTGITTNPIWVQYDIYFAMIFGIVITSLVWWKGRDVSDSIRGIARVRATEPTTGIAYQTAPSAGPVAIPQAATVAPQPVAVEQKKEE